MPLGIKMLFGQCHRGYLINVGFANHKTVPSKNMQITATISPQKCTLTCTWKYRKHKLLHGLHSEGAYAQIMSENLSAFKCNSLKGEETIKRYFFQAHRKYITPRKYAKNSPIYMQKFLVCQEHLKRLLVDFPQPLKVNLTAISCTFDNIPDHNSFNTTQ